MGEVYVAEDTRLTGAVALKVLPRLTRRRSRAPRALRARGRAVAALNHPGIVTIHSVEEDRRRARS